MHQSTASSLDFLEETKSLERTRIWKISLNIRRTGVKYFRVRRVGAFRNAFIILVPQQLTNELWNRWSTSERNEKVKKKMIENI